MPLSITDPSGNPLGALTLIAERGVPSDHISIKIQNIGALSVDGLFAVMYAEAVSGDYVTDGHPAVDERQGRFQITSIDSSGTPGQDTGITTPQAAGHLANPQLPSILAGNSIFADVWIEQPTTSAGGGAVNIKLEFANEAAAFAVEDGVTEVGRGIISGKNSPRSFLIAGRLLTASGSPDDKVHVAVGSWLYLGVEGTDASIEDVTLDQNDGAAAALLTGEAYIAAISQGLSSTPTTTKGAKALTSGAGPLQPQIPFGDTLLGFVTVNYGVSGSVISGANLDQTDVSYGRYLVVGAATGLTATVGFGEALTSGYRQAKGVRTTVTFAASMTNYVWLEYTGVVSVNTTGLEPSPGALLLATVVTGSSNITSVTDNRTYVGQAGTLSLHASTHATGGTDPVSPASIGAATTAAVALLAPIDSPVFTTTQTGVTVADLDNSTQLATTAWVNRAIGEAIAPIYHELNYTSDGTTQPSVFSPVAITTRPIRVFVGGLRQRMGIGLDFTFASNLVTFTTVPANGQLVTLEWEALS